MTRKFAFTYIFDVFVLGKIKEDNKEKTRDVCLELNNGGMLAPYVDKRVLKEILLRYDVKL